MTTYYKCGICGYRGDDARHVCPPEAVDAMWAGLYDEPQGADSRRSVAAQRDLAGPAAVATTPAALQAKSDTEPGSRVPAPPGKDWAFVGTVCGNCLALVGERYEEFGVPRTEQVASCSRCSSDRAPKPDTELGTRTETERDARRWRRLVEMARTDGALRDAVLAIVEREETEP